MSTPPPYALPPTFLGTSRSDTGAAYCVVGIPFDLGVSVRPGARMAPTAIRLASRMLCDGRHPGHWSDPLALDLADLGDLRLPHGDVARSMAAIEQQVASLAHVVALGGDHTVTLPLLRALVQRTGPLGLVHFDAHPDTWPDTFGQSPSHGSVFFDAIAEGLIDCAASIQVGIRSPMPREVWDWTLGKGLTIVTAEEVHLAGPEAIATRIRETVGQRPAYLSFDVDAVDPSQAPGTGTPEIGGLFTWQVQAILRRLGPVAFAGMDVVEVCPPYDHADITALLGATVAWEYLSLAAVGRRP